MIRITCSNKGSMAVRRQDICHRSRIGTIVSIKYRLAEIKGAGPHKHPQSHLSLITALLFSHAFTNFLSLPQPYFTLYHTHFPPFLLSLPPPDFTWKILPYLLSSPILPPSTATLYQLARKKAEERQSRRGSIDSLPWLASGLEINGNGKLSYSLWINWRHWRKAQTKQLGAQCVNLVRLQCKGCLLGCTLEIPWVWRALFSSAYCLWRDTKAIVMLLSCIEMITSVFSLEREKSWKNLMYFKGTWGQFR